MINQKIGETHLEENKMSNAPKKIFLSDHDATILKQYCKGCQFFKPENNTKSICSIISWYDPEIPNNMAQLVSHVKGCPCNKKCIVKAACTEEQCPMWLEYVQNLADKRVTKLVKRWSKKNSR